MKLLYENKNYYAEARLKLFGSSKWGKWLPLNSTYTIKSARKAINSIKEKDKSKDEWEFRIIFRKEQHFIVE